MAVARETVSDGLAPVAKKQARPAKVVYPHISLDMAVGIKCADMRVQQELYDLANLWAREQQSTGAYVGFLKGAKQKECLNDVAAESIDYIEEQLEFLKNNYDHYASLTGDDKTVLKALHDCDQLFLNIAYACKDAWRCSQMLQQFTGNSFAESSPKEKAKRQLEKAVKSGLTKAELAKLLEELPE